MNAAKKAGLWLAYLLLVIPLQGVPTFAAIILNSSLSISGEYTDNLFFTEQDKKSDVATIVTPTFNIDFTSRNVVLNIEYSGSAVFYSQNPEADGYFQSLSFNIDFPGLNHQFRGLEVRIIERVSYSPELGAYSFGSQTLTFEERFNQVLLEGEGIQGKRTDTFRNFAGIVLSYSWSQNFVTTTSYTNILTRYAGPVPEDTDINVVAMDGTYRYQASSRTEWMARYGISSTIGEQENDLFHQMSVSVLHQVTRLVAVNGQIGVSLVEGESPAMLLGAGITKAYREGRLSLQYTSNVVVGLGVIEGLVRRHSVVGEATRSLGARTTSYIQVGYVSNQSFQVNRIDITSYTTQTGVTTQFLSWLHGNLSYTYLKQQAQGTFGQDGERNVVNISLTASAPPFRILN